MADRGPGRVSAEVDWREVARLVLTSREMDRIEEQELVPAKKVLYQFSARGHDMAQVLLGMQLKGGDGAFGYYRSRPLLPDPPPVRVYQQGSWGPNAIHQLIAPHAWRLPFERGWRRPNPMAD